MKIFFSILLLVISQILFAQKKLTDITTNTESADRAEILNALRTVVEKELDQQVTFVVRSLKMKDSYAFLKGNVKTESGKNIDFKQTTYKEAIDGDMFSGDEIVALLKKTNGKWVYLTHAIGANGIVYACWWQHYNAPKALFDKNERCGDKY